MITKREYDWVSTPAHDPLSGNPSCAVAGAALRKTGNTYWNAAGGLSGSHAADAPDIGVSNAYWNPGAQRKRDSVLETRIYAGENTTAAVAQFAYDNPNTTGNVRFEYRWDNPDPGNLDMSVEEFVGRFRQGSIKQAAAGGLTA